MTVSLASISPADGAVNVLPNVPVIVRLQNVASTALTVLEDPSDFGAGTLTDVDATTGGLRLDSVDTVYSIQAPAANALVGRNGPCVGMPSGTTAWTAFFGTHGVNTANWRCALAWGLDNGNAYVMIYYNNTTIRVATFGAFQQWNATLCDGSWHRVAVRYYSGYVEVWIDGVQLAGGPKALVIDLNVSHASSTIRLMGNPGAGLLMTVGDYLDEVQVWPFYAPDAEIAYWDGIPTPGLLALGAVCGHWPLNDGSGTVCIDLSANNYDLSVLVGGNNPTWEAGSPYGVESPVYDATGNRISPAIDVSSVVEYGDTRVTWDCLLPAGTTLVVEASDAAVGPWVAVTNGGRIVGVWAHGDAMAGQSLYMRYTLATTDNTETPRLRWVKIEFLPINPAAVEVDVNGVTFSYLGGTLNLYGNRDIVGGVAVDDYSDIYLTTQGRWHHDLDGRAEAVEVRYGATVVDSTAFTPLEVYGWPGGGPVISPMGSVNAAVAFRLEAHQDSGVTVAVSWTAVAIQSGAEATTYFVVQALTGAEADAYYYIARVVINDQPFSSLAVGKQWLNDHHGSFCVDGYRVDDVTGSITIQGWVCDDHGGSCAVTIQVCSDQGGALMTAQQAVADLPGSVTVRGVFPGTTFHARSVPAELKAMLAAMGITVS